MVLIRSDRIAFYCVYLLLWSLAKQVVQETARSPMKCGQTESRQTCTHCAASGIHKQQQKHKKKDTATTGDCISGLQNCQRFVERQANTAGRLLSARSFLQLLAVDSIVEAAVVAA